MRRHRFTGSRENARNKSISKSHARVDRSTEASAYQHGRLRATLRLRAIVRDQRNVSDCNYVDPRKGSPLCAGFPSVEYGDRGSDARDCAAIDSGSSFLSHARRHRCSRHPIVGVLVFSVASPRSVTVSVRSARQYGACCGFAAAVISTPPLLTRAGPRLHALGCGLNCVRRDVGASDAVCPGALRPQIGKFGGPQAIDCSSACSDSACVPRWGLRRRARPSARERHYPGRFCESRFKASAVQGGCAPFH